MSAERPRPRRKAGSDFSRIKPVEVVEDRPTVQDLPLDPEGKRALFSPPASATPEQPAAALGAVVIDCGRCGESTVLSPGAALHHVVPSLHLPFIKPKRGSWMQCPACRHRTWVSVQIRL